MFQFFSEVFGLSPTIIVSNPNFVKKVVFPLEVLPAANVLGAGFHMLISLGLLMIGNLLLGPGLTPLALWLPVILIPVILIALGASWLFAALGVFFRDVNQVMQFLTMALMFASAVFYSAKKIPPEAWMFLRFNPLLLAIELARDAALWARPINLHHLAYLYATGLLACYFGHLAFSKMKPAFADVL